MYYTFEQGSIVGQVQGVATSDDQPVVCSPVSYPIPHRSGEMSDESRTDKSSGGSASLEHCGHSRYDRAPGNRGKHASKWYGNRLKNGESPTPGC